MELDDSDAQCAFESAVATDGSATVQLRGEVDLANVASLRQEVEELLRRHPPQLVFDLTDLTFIDSSGLALLVEAAEAVTELKVRNPSALVQRIIQGTGLSNVLRIES
jgi:anti-anti-sigma factor